MPAKDDADFGDGTQSALPPVAFGDALSGSVNEDDDFTLTKVASPVRPDSRAVPEFADASVSETQRSGGEFTADPTFDTTPPGIPAEPIPPSPPLGMLPRQRARPSLASFRRPQLRMPRLPQVGEVRRPSSGSTAIIVAALLSILYAVVAIEFLSSLISSISGLFH
ncbi:hypothetical protein [Amycolatopsis pithecellobii]|nr:hypothetical protein [Amycolatopsis pithecellobii]